jgi:tetratricopeptide (TPR) repeat protein
VSGRALRIVCGMPRLIPIGRLLCAVLLGILSGSAHSSPEISVWEKVSVYQSAIAELELDDLPEPIDEQAMRERDFSAAVVHLDQQPLSESRLDAVEKRFVALIEAEGNDEIARASRYLLGRIAQLFRAKPDVAKAADYFRGLVEQPGPGIWSEQARLKLTLLTLYVLPIRTPSERLKLAENYLEAARDPIAVRDMHRLLARAILFYNFPPKRALEHLLAADKIGGLVGTQASSQLVQIGELAWDEGDEELAAHYYERLAKEYPRDPRIFTMQQRLAGEPTPGRGEVVNGR